MATLTYRSDTRGDRKSPARSTSHPTFAVPTLRVSRPADGPIVRGRTDTVLKWLAGTAWLLSVWALVATAGAALPSQSEAPLQTAIVPVHERTTTPRPAPQQRFETRDRFDSSDRFRLLQPVATPAPTRDCPECESVPATRRNYRELFRPVTTPQTPVRDRFDVRDRYEQPVRGEQPFGGSRLTPVRTQPVQDLAPPTRTPTRGFDSPVRTQPSYTRPDYTRPDYSRPDCSNGFCEPAPGHRRTPTSADKVQHRYSNPQVIRMGRDQSVGDATQLYLELSDLIDRRHVAPIGYEARTRAAIEGVSAALNSPAFQQAAGMTADRDAIARTQATLDALAARSARSSHEGLGLMQQTASIVARGTGASQGLVAMEFVHATLDSLDRYSSLVPTSTAAIEGDLPTQALVTDGFRQTAGLEERIVGIGVEMKASDNGALVNGTVSGGPAAAAGLTRGDVITHIDGRSLAGLSIGQIADLVGGPAGSTLTLTLDRDGQRFDRRLTRRSLYVSSVADVRMVEDGIGYARLKQFSAGSHRDLEKALWTLHRQGMKGFVLDLRGNPGGLLTAAISISDLFLPSGSIVQTRGRTADDQMHERAQFAKTWAVPLVVLIDEGSASASEILAAAIQENDRGVIVGSRSYGKGTVQTHFPLRSLAANAKLTTAKFYSPEGREMAGAGVLPNVTVDPTDDAATLEAAVQTLRDGTPQDLASNLSRRIRR